jgi:predicted alpha/beta superfamily hydrolase
MENSEVSRQHTGLMSLVLVASALVAPAVSSAAVASIEVDPASAVLPEGIEVRDVTSQEVGDTFRVFIGQPVASETSDPSSEDRSPQVYPVIYVLDGNGMFLDVLLMARWLARSGEVPPAVIVGIGYPIASFWDTMNLRSRDYTPTADAELLEVANRTMWPGLPDVETATTGGADAFLDFIQSELMPMIEKEHGGDPNDATIVGHSFGGLLGSYALVSRPGLFQRHVITSPSLWWDDGYLLELEPKLASKRDDLPARVFFSVGAFEAEDIQLEKFRSMPPERFEAMREFMEHIGTPFMVRRMLILEHMLAMHGYPGLHTKVEVFDEENHGSVRFTAMSRGLRFVFAE